MARLKLDWTPRGEVYEPEDGGEAEVIDLGWTADLPGVMGYYVVDMTLAEDAWTADFTDLDEHETHWGFFATAEEAMAVCEVHALAQQCSICGRTVFEPPDPKECLACVPG